MKKFLFLLFFITQATFSVYSQNEDSLSLNSDSLQQQQDSLLNVLLERYPIDTNTYWKLDIEDILNTREVNGSRITDDANLLSDSAKHVIDSLLISLEDSLGYQIAVVNLDSIGNQNMRTFGTDLFNFWGIGQEGKDNGLLIFNVMNIRRIEFITGYGTETVLTDWQCQQIQQVEMIPHYKEGNQELGIIKGVKTVIQVLRNNTPDYLIKPIEEKVDYNSEPYQYHYMKLSEIRSIKDLYTFLEQDFLILFFLTISLIIAIIPAIIFIINFLVALFSKKLTPHQRYKKIWWADHLFIALLFPLPFLFFYPIIKLSRYIWKRQSQGQRSRKFISEKTGDLMKRLNDRETNLLLSKGLVGVSDVGSKLIKIWANEDETEIIVRHFDKQWSFWSKPYHGKYYNRYSQCKKCKFKKQYYDGFEIIKDDGIHQTVRTKYYCKNCKEHTNETSERKKPIYRASKSGSSSSSSWPSFSSSSSSSSSSRSSSSSSGSSSSSSSSSGGSSYGGGKSGSGGSGSSW